MWSRKELKEKAKQSFKQNYWKVILVTLIVFMIGGASTTFSFSNSGSSDSDSLVTDDYYEDDYADSYLDDSLDEDFTYEEDIFSSLGITEDSVALFVGIFVIVFIVVLIIVLVVAVFISTFLWSPLEVGANRFFFKNLNQKAEVKEVAYAFDNGYLNVVKILFFRNLYTFLWSLLFVIPGIVKSYEYMMIPYLLAENPNLTKEEAFKLSKQMMTGNKWNAFVLDLSFIGWNILSSFTLGILSIFYVQPYKCMTYAALYEELSLINGRPALAQPVQSVYEEPVNTTQSSTYTTPSDTYNSPEE